MSDWLLETLVWTAALIALVLVLRRPVARLFGPQIAYALWAIPVLRLFLPPLELPAWMNPAPEPALEGEGITEITVFDPAPLAPISSEASGAGLAASDAPAASHLPPDVGLIPFPDTGILIEVGIAVWLIGAAIFLYQRFAAYFELRDELLGGANEVGRLGIGRWAKVRLIETSGTNAPLAFGVIDKVIALPEGFLAQPDRRARDLALAHEMAHHRGRDLLVNVLVQPLFAMHWWNPLGRYGWLALRRDQEAACDARVMNGVMTGELESELFDSAPEERPEIREAYANLIVSFAAAPGASHSHALTAPMACPVLGDKSIIHRLRSLNMNETTANRRLAGRLMLGAAVLALPLTASVTYAASEAPLAPEAPQSAEAPAAPAPPAPPAAPDAPMPPEAPEAPAIFVDEDETRIVIIDPDGESSEGNRKFRAIIKERSEAFPHAEGKVAERTLRFFPKDGGENLEVHVERFFEQRDAMNPEERKKLRIELRRAFAEADKAMDDMPRIVEEALAESRAARLEAGKARTIIEMTCDENSDDVATTREGPDGSKVVMLCQKRVIANAMDGLREAREAIAGNAEMDSASRKRALGEIDRVIEKWESRGS